jgi:hypothetical protein
MKGFKKGNAILAIHINSLQAKDRTTKPLGPNPLEYLGVTYSVSGLTATLHEVLNGNWKEYAELDGGASYQVPAVPEQYRGKGFSFGQWYHIYDWVLNDGYNNFSDWVC